MYNPRIWYDGDIVTSGGLNNIEQGIAQNAHDIETINDSIEDLSADAKARLFWISYFVLISVAVVALVA